MEYQQYIRKPFTVTAVEITADNIAEVAELVGKVQTNENGEFIQLNRRVVPNVGRAYVGWFMTKLGDNYRCYSPKVFNEQFMNYASPVAWTFGENSPVEQMDRAGWNYNVAKAAEEAEDDVDSAPASGYERPDVVELIGVDIPSVSARSDEDMENDAVPVDANPYGRQRSMPLDESVD